MHKTTSISRCVSAIVPVREEPVISAGFYLFCHFKSSSSLLIVWSSLYVAPCSPWVPRWWNCMDLLKAWAYIHVIYCDILCWSCIYNQLWSAAVHCVPLRKCRGASQSVYLKGIFCVCHLFVPHGVHFIYAFSEVELFLHIQVRAKKQKNNLATLCVLRSIWTNQFFPTARHHTVATL